MRSYRVFNDVHNVRVVWKLAGFRLGAFAQRAMLWLMAFSTLTILIAGPIPAAVLFVVGFAAITRYVTALSRIDPAGVMSERTALALLRRGIKHRHTANFDISEL